MKITEEELEEEIDKIEYCEKFKLIVELSHMDTYFNSVKHEIKECIQESISRQQMELDTGGNVRFEEWRDTLALSDKSMKTFNLVRQLTCSKYVNPG